MDELEYRLRLIAERLCYKFQLAAHYSRWRDWDSVIIVDPLGDYQINYYASSDTPYRIVIGNLSVSPNMRRKGIATKLLMQAESDAKLINMTSIMLGVDRDAPDWLLEWYKRLGYEFHSYDEDGDTLLIKYLTNKDESK